MRLIAKARLRLRSLVRRSRVEDELDAELRFHGRGAESQFVGGLWVSGGFFPALRVVPERGRLFTAADDYRGCAPAGAVIIHAFWQSHFTTFGIPIGAPRDINEFDTTDGRKVALVNDTFVLRYRGNGDAIGRTLRTIAEPGYPEAVYEVIGVVGDTKNGDLREGNPPIAYVPLSQHPNVYSLKGIVIRASGSLPDVIAEVRRRAATVSPDVAMGFTVLETQLRNGLVRERLMAWLSGFFGVLAAVLLFGLSPYDVPTLVTAVALLATTAGLAGYVPARRASNVDPMEALRCE